MHYSTKIIELGSCAFRQPKAKSHCRFVHGYRLTAKFWFAANELDENNWVVDFGGLKELKKLLQNQFDHTTCISRTDPKLDEFKRLEQAGVCDLRIMDGVGIEKFAEWCHAAADNFVGVITKLRCRCVRVEVFEHENNSAIYESYPEQELQSVSNQKTASVKTEVKTSKPATTTDFAGNPLPDSQNTQQEKVDKPADKKSGQHKTHNSWVDPKFKGRTKNTWLF
jgi:6-pyruvoyltetrahydropterin/6-carboxytetrahydropterin synthase